MGYLSGIKLLREVNGYFWLNPTYQGQPSGDQEPCCGCTGHVGSSHWALRHAGRASGEEASQVPC